MHATPPFITDDNHRIIKLRLELGMHFGLVQILAKTTASQNLQAIIRFTNGPSLVQGNVYMLVFIMGYFQFYYYIFISQQRVVPHMPQLQPLPRSTNSQTIAIY